MLAIGSRAPEFTLPDQDDRSVSLSTLLNRGPLILYFYPADFTPGCTREACMLRDMHAEILRVGLAVAGISPQSPERHREFREKYKLPFTLLSDVEKFVVSMYDVNGPLGLGVRRGTYLIDQARVIRSAMLADFRIGKHEAFIRRAVALSAGMDRAAKGQPLKAPSAQNLKRTRWAWPKCGTLTIYMASPSSAAPSGNSAPLERMQHLRKSRTAGDHEDAASGVLAQ